MENTNPKVYVGTWKKYNNGSIKGAWIDLTEFSCYADFVKKCTEIHKDENDPEFMIQDYENFPDGLSAGDWLCEKEFKDIISAFQDELSGENESKFQIIDYSEKAIAVIGDTKAIKDELKKLGGRFNPRLNCGAGWIFSKSKLEQLQSLINNDKVVIQEPGSTDKSNYKAVLAEYIANCNDKFYKDYHSKHSVGAVKINGGYYLIEKPRIENKFCWADEGPAYDHYKEVHSSDENLKRYFLAENLKGFEQETDTLLTTHEVFLTAPNKRGEVYFYKLDHFWHREKRNETDVQITPEQCQELIDAINWSKNQFEKRLQAYLKRYGTSKLHTWPYWADR